MELFVIFSALFRFVLYGACNDKLGNVVARNVKYSKGVGGSPQPRHIGGYLVVIGFHILILCKQRNAVFDLAFAVVIGEYRC